MDVYFTGKLPFQKYSFSNYIPIAIHREVLYHI